jgi:hypothetical protein
MNLERGKGLGPATAGLASTTPAPELDLDLSLLRSRLNHQVEWGLYRSAEASEPSSRDNIPEPRFPRLRPQG